MQNPKILEEKGLKVKIRRQWNDWRIAEIDFSKLRNIRWDRFSGGVDAPCPQYFIHAYVWCDEYQGEIAHSCQHGVGPHSIKVCVTKVDNDPVIFSKLIEVAGPKPRYFKHR